MLFFFVFSSASKATESQFRRNKKEAKKMIKAINSVGSVFRQAGKALDKAGAALEAASYQEGLVLSTTSVTYKNHAPALAKAAFVAPTASIIGQVSVGSGSSVWYNATLRGDVNSITIGEKCSIGDGVTIHVDKLPTTVGDNVTVGPEAVLHACSVGDACVIGAGATVLDGAKLETNAVLAPGALLSPGKTVPAKQLWAGVPAALVRELSAAEVKAIETAADKQLELSKLYAAETSKDWEQVLEEEEFHEDLLVRDDPLPVKPVIPTEVDGIVPGRIFNNHLNSKA
mmetsp:Transcript_38161/g.48144  ORF Transcript_38161/g.48144 Transcript_38161/m.48144 type:complete len:286 (+) Transcript_38161:3-860(+)